MNQRQIFELIQEQVKFFRFPAVDVVAQDRDPYRILISCILSLRTTDDVTISSSRRLFAAAGTARAMVKLPLPRLRSLIYPAGFYRTKAKEILNISRRILKEFSGKVPDDLDALLLFKGVGRKTANLVLGLGYGVPAVCVDTHVHRISNRLGWVKTAKPFDTERALEKIFPRAWWIRINGVMVSFGQNICRPLSPWCGKCAAKKYCPGIGVKKAR